MVSISNLAGLPVYAALASGVLAAAAVPVSAQSEGSFSREVVQPLPSQEVQDLNRALMRLARNPKSLPALVDAGNASLKLGDLDAAMGFFGRAQELSPDNAEVKMGMAVVFLRSDRPIEALRLFSEAEAAGASPREVLADRGLAYDLVGNNVEAQASYRAALRVDETDETIRRLALSQAISGDREAFEETLQPLLEKRDFGAYRTRAFGLAILGDQEEAAAITDAVMPRDLASRMTPYLQFMPRLTKAQQAAAANLGIFPRAAQIGRDDPRIASFASRGSAITAAADARLAPTGEPLGSATRPAASPPPIAEADPPDLSRIARVEEPVDAATAPGFNLGRGGEGSGDAARTPLANVEDAFSGFTLDAMPDANAGEGAVDITAIDVPRETPSEPEAVEPAHPSRQWVQVATGRDRSALKFDWRRISRRASDLLGDYQPHVVRWGESNRLLAGPVDTRSNARALVNALKEKGIDTFTYTSPEGQEIQELK